MLVFIDERGFFYCLASNNTLCWWCVIFIARTPVCTARKERIWPEVATIVHSLIGQNEPCSLPWTTDITVLLKATKHKSKMQRITLKKTFNMWSFFYFFYFFFSLTQLWLCYMVYKHEKERNALKLMHISLHLKESCVNQCIDEVLWGLKALHRVLTSECANKKKVCSSQPENGLFFFLPKSCIPVNVPALNRVTCVCEGLLTRTVCSHMLHLQYVTVWMGMKVSA